MTDKIRPYLFYDLAVSVCSTCYRKVEGKIVFEDGKVLLLKRCPEHGNERVLVADDVEYYSPFIAALAEPGGPGSDGRLVGKGPVREYFAAALARYDDLH
ncbi:MAG: hypothetical protein ABR562_04465, partial [Thermoplasmatota archaeon]